MSEEIRVVLVEDQAPLRDGLRSLIEAKSDFRVVGSHGSMEEALAAPDPSADVGLFDIGLPGIDGVEGVRRWRARSPSTQILMLTVFSDRELVFDALCAGACGYLLKDTPPARLLEAIREVKEGGAPMTPEIARKVITTFQRTPEPQLDVARLSPRERDVLELLAEGHAYKTAASALGLSQDTIRFHIRHIYEKLHVHSKSEAVIKAIRSGLVS